MPIRPHPTTYHCPACGWSKTTAPRSDVLMPGDMPTACPQCQHTPLDHQRANIAQATLADLAQRLQRFGR